MGSDMQNNPVFFLAESYEGSDITKPTVFECKIKRDWVTSNSSVNLKVGEIVEYYAGYKIFTSTLLTTTTQVGSTDLQTYTVTDSAAVLAAVSSLFVASYMF